MVKQSVQTELKSAKQAIADNAEAFELYYKELVSWNEKINLTAITERNDVYIKHFEDSLALLDVLELNKGTSLIDIGSGAGFPGLAMKAGGCMADVTLLDSTRKRVDFFAAYVRSAWSGLHLCLGCGPRRPRMMRITEAGLILPRQGRWQSFRY